METWMLTTICTWKLGLVEKSKKIFTIETDVENEEAAIKNFWEFLEFVEKENCIFSDLETVRLK